MYTGLSSKRETGREGSPSHTERGEEKEEQAPELGPAVGHRGSVIGGQPSQLRDGTTALSDAHFHVAHLMQNDA
jgi:hypothetical protein